jgi:protein-tyrosine phosphatase
VKNWSPWAIEFGHFPSRDMTSISIDTMERAIVFVVERLAVGKSVYIHCKAGRGRSVSLVAAILSHIAKLVALTPASEKTMHEILEFLRRVRPQTSLSESQLDFLYHFHDTPGEEPMFFVEPSLVSQMQSSDEPCNSTSS